MKTAFAIALVLTLTLAVGSATVLAIAPQTVIDSAPVVPSACSDAEISRTLSAMDDVAFELVRTERELAPAQGRLAGYYRETLQIADAIDSAKINAVMVYGELMTREEAREVLVQRLALIEKYEAAVAELETIAHTRRAMLTEMTAHLHDMTARRAAWAKSMAMDSAPLAAAKTRLAAPLPPASESAVALADARAAFRTNPVR